MLLVFFEYHKKMNPTTFFLTFENRSRFLYVISSFFFFVFFKVNMLCINNPSSSF